MGGLHHRQMPCSWAARGRLLLAGSVHPSFHGPPKPRKRVSMALPLPATARSPSRGSVHSPALQSAVTGWPGPRVRFRVSGGSLRDCALAAGAACLSSGFRLACQPAGAVPADFAEPAVLLRRGCVDHTTCWRRLTIVAGTMRHASPRTPATVGACPRLLASGPAAVLATPWPGLAGCCVATYRHSRVCEVLPVCHLLCT